MRLYKKTTTAKKHIIGTDPGLPPPENSRLASHMVSNPATGGNTAADGPQGDVVEIDSSDYEMLDKSGMPIDGSDAENVSEALDAEPRDMDEDVLGHDDDEIEEITPPTRQQPDPRRVPPLSLLATDFENVSKRLMKPVPDYPVKDESYVVWEIKDWNALRKEEKVRGPEFECGGYTWNVLLFPKGSNDLISMYMEPHPPKDADGNVDPNWYVCAQFAFDMWNPNHPEVHYPSSSSHRFNKNETDWGFSSFISVRDLLNAAKFGRSHSLMEKNQFNLTGYVRVIDDTSTGVLWHNWIDYDSKAQTGYVGLNNQGATCYLNSLLQSYYTTRTFRDLVNQIPTDPQSETKSKAVPLALQRIFYLLQLSNEPVGTMELTKSFGWDSTDAFTQHDIQELNRVLMDKLEMAMKGTKIENKLNDLFVGKMKSYIKCVDVPYESSREEDFWDIQLNVRGFKNLTESFKNYIEIEMLDGENKYQAGDQYGYQDAKKGVVFRSFPPILHLQLKRFEYDFMVDDLVKIDDYYEFPDRVDLRPFLDEDLPEEVKNENWNYKLHGVLVHQGSISNGHYYGLIKPESHDDEWLRFDDDKVWKATPNQVFYENYGASEISPQQLRLQTRSEQNEYLIRRATSAYMLVYLRESELEKLLPPNNTLAPTPKYVAEQIEKEQEEFLKAETARKEALFYMYVKIITVKNFASYNGFDTYPDPTEPRLYDENIFHKDAYPTTIKVKKDAPFSQLYEKVAEQLGYEIPNGTGQTSDKTVSVDSEGELRWPFRLLCVSHRNNRTNRPDAPVAELLQDATVSQVYTQCFKRRYEEMVFFVDEPQKQLQSIDKAQLLISPEQFDFEAATQRILSNKSSRSWDDDTSNSIRIFVKYFDPVSDEVRGLTYARVPLDAQVSLLTPIINNVLQFDASTPLTYFEEVTHTSIEPIDENLTFEKNELGTGDILTVQLADIESATFDRLFVNAKEYYEFLLTRLHIHVKPFKANEEEEDSDFVADEEKNGDNRNGDQTKASQAEVAEIELAKEMSKSTDMWILTQFSYAQLADAVAKKLGDNVDPAKLRLFVVNNHGTRFPLLSFQSLSQVFTKQVSVSSVTNFEYEILNITLKEYENLQSVKIYWMNSIQQFHLFDLLVPKTSTVADLVRKLIHKLDIPPKLWSNLLVWAGQESKYSDLVKFDRQISDLPDASEVYCGYFPAEVEILVSNDLFKRFDEKHVSKEDIEDELLRLEFEKAQKTSQKLNLVPVFHFHKNPAYNHSKPFIFAVFPGEPFEETKIRLRKKLGLGGQAFDKVRIALTDANDKGRYLDSDNPNLELFEEIKKFDADTFLALDHPDRNPRRPNPFEKGISIR